MIADSCKMCFPARHAVYGFLWYMVFLFHTEEEESSDCLSHTSSTKTKSSQCDEKTPPDMDVGSRFSSSEVTEAPNKRRHRSCSVMMKQTSLDCPVRAASSGKSASPLLFESKARAKEKLQQLRKSQIRSSLSITETEVNQILQSTKEIKTNVDSGDRDESLLPKYACSPKSIGLKSQKVLSKKKQLIVSVPDDRFDARIADHSIDEDSVFDDYFTSANDAPKQKVLVVNSASEAERLPSFDLEPLNRIRRKSQIQEKCTKNRKALNETVVMEASGPPEEELAACIGASLPGSKESEFEKPEQVPAAKKRRRRTKQNSATLPESKDDRNLSNYS